MNNADMFLLAKGRFYFAKARCAIEDGVYEKNNGWLYGLDRTISHAVRDEYHPAVIEQLQFLRRELDFIQTPPTKT